MPTDTDYMNRCKALAEQAAAKGNAPVGVLIIKDNKIICGAEEAATTKRDITCHAEIEAIRKAVLVLKSTDLSGCDLYTTHEPCIMCAYAIRYYKIRKVVYGAASAYLGSVSSSMPLLITNDVPPHWSNAPEVIQLNP